MSNFNWNYNPNDYSANNSNLLEEGKYRVRVINAKQTVAKNGTDGLEISLEVYGHSNKLRHYIWYNRETPARTNQLLGEFFNSFDIKPDEMSNCDAWTGKSGAVYVMHDAYKGRTIAKVSFCIAREHQNDIPEWPVDYFSSNSKTDTPKILAACTVGTPMRDMTDFNF